MKHQADATSYPHSDGLTTIWSIVEASKTFPALIVVAAATDADDTTAIARGLADVSQQAGQRTGYLRLGADGSGVKPAGSYTELSVVTRGAQREAFDSAREAWRSSFDVVIIDAAKLSAQALGAHVARVADGVVIAVCKERRVVGADRDLSTLLAQLSASVIGAVLTGPARQPIPSRAARRHSRLEPAAAP